MNKIDSQLTIVLPVYNEIKSLPVSLPEIISGCKKNNFRLVVIDDGSQDGSREYLDQIGFENATFAQVIHHKVNRGYGGALKTGILSTKTRFILTMDADGQHIFDDVIRIFEMALTQEADLVIGKREGISSGWFRNLGKWLIKTFTNYLIPIKDIDLNSGFKLYRTEFAAKYCKVCPEGMAFSDVITIIFLSEKKYVRSIPINIRERIAGESTIGIYTAFDTVLEILNIIMLFNPLRIFLPASIFSILIGTIWAIPILFMGKGVSVGSMLAIVVGVLFFILGLLAHQLSEIRLSTLR